MSIIRVFLFILYSFPIFVPFLVGIHPAGSILAGFLVVHKMYPVKGFIITLFFNPNLISYAKPGRRLSQNDMMDELM